MDYSNMEALFLDTPVEPMAVTVPSLTLTTMGRPSENSMRTSSPTKQKPKTTNWSWFFYMMVMKS